MKSTIYYIINRKWMNKTFETFTQAYAYAEKRINEPGFTFRKIVTGTETIDNVNGKGCGFVINSNVRFYTTAKDVERLINNEK